VSLSIGLDVADFGLDQQSALRRSLAAQYSVPLARLAIGAVLPGRSASPAADAAGCVCGPVPWSARR
jgi:hypothetical protein